MRKRTIAAGTIALCIGIPAAVLAGAGEDNPDFTDLAVSGGLTVWHSNGTVTTNSKTFKPVPGLPQWEPAEFDYDPGAIVRVSVDLRGGKASVRLRDPGGSDAQFGPDSALIAGKGVSTATFLVAGDTMTNPVVQWKRVGDARVKAASVIADVIGPLD